MNQSKQSELQARETAFTEKSAQNVESADADTMDAIFRLLTEEIRDRHEVGKLEGWTPWLIIGTLVAISSALLQLLWDRHPNWETVKIIYLASCGAWMGWRVIFSTFTSSSPKMPRDGMFAHLHSSTDPLQLLARLAWILSAALVTYELNPASMVWSILAFRWFMIVCAIIGVFALIVVMARISFPISDTKGWVSIVIDLAIVGICSHMFIHLISSSIVSDAAIEDVKCGLLLSVAAIALLILSKGRSDQSTQKDMLIDLRQEIILGNITATEAKHRAQVSLRGLFISDVVAKDIGKLLKLVDEVRRLYADAFAKIETLKNTTGIGGDPAPKLDSVAKLALANTLDLLVTYETGVTNISAEYFKRLRGIKLRMNIVIQGNKQATTDKEILLAEIRQSQTLADADLQRFENEYFELQDFWNSQFSKERRDHKPFSAPLKRELEATG